jgi:radial spoke head protein 1
LLIGQFIQGKRQGKGTYSYVNGDIYDGEWENDVKQGQGTYTYACGSKKSGKWVQGVLQGDGEIIHADVTISGKFVGNDNMQMPVKVKYASTGYEKVVFSPSAVNMEATAAI